MKIQKKTKTQNTDTDATTKKPLTKLNKTTKTTKQTKTPKQTPNKTKQPQTTTKQKTPNPHYFLYEFTVRLQQVSRKMVQVWKTGNFKL